MRLLALLGPLPALALLGGTAPAQELLAYHEGLGRFERAGSAVAPLGDVDGDGRLEWIVGATGVGNDNPTGHASGSVRVMHATHWQGVELVWSAFGDQSFDWFGAAVASVPDVDGDGIPDVLVGAPHDQVAISQPIGSARLYSGVDGTLLRTIDGVPGRASEFGGAVAGLHDLDGDGAGELAVADAFELMPNGTRVGGVWVFSGRTGAVLFHRTGEAHDERYGQSIANAGDVDGDGFDDLAIGAPHCSLLAPGAGRVRVCSVKRGIVLWTVEGTAAGELLGWSLAAIGDLGGDGVGELAAGAPGAFPLGAVALLDGHDGGLVRRHLGDVRSDHLGMSVAGPGDVNGDGVPDVVAGAPDGENEVWGRLGHVMLFSGRSGLLLRRLYQGLFPPTVGRFGEAVAAVGDVDRDGLMDVLIGAPEAAQEPDSFAYGGAFVLGGDDLFLDVWPTFPVAGDDLELVTREATPGALTLLAVVDVDGFGVFQVLDLAHLGADGGRSLAATVPPGLEGMSIGLLAWVQDPARRRLQSNFVVVRPGSY